MGIKVSPDWWKILFDGLYLKTDARSVCDENITSRESGIISRLLTPVSGQRVLDLCGGQGRHSLHLGAQVRVRCTVLDFSGHLVRLGNGSARQRGVPVSFVQGDARDAAFPDGVFDHVLLMGNSLGYLPNPEDDEKILRESFRVLKPGAALLLDITDGERVHAATVPTAWHEVDDDLVVCRERELEDGRIKARELVFSREKGLIREQAYAIRLYSSARVRALLTGIGFIKIRVLKDFRPHDNDGDYGFMNRRILAVARKPQGGGENP